jgi:hypothetical protein
VSVCAVDGCTGAVSSKFSAERVSVDGVFLDLCPSHVTAHKRRFKVRPPRGVKLFFVEIDGGRAWLVRETSKLRAQKAVAKIAATLTSRNIEWSTVMDKATKVCVANPDNIQTGILMVGRLAWAGS